MGGSFSSVGAGVGLAVGAGVGLAVGAAVGVTAPITALWFVLFKVSVSGL